MHGIDVRIVRVVDPFPFGVDTNMDLDVHASANAVHGWALAVLAGSSKKKDNRVRELLSHSQEVTTLQLRGEEKLVQSSIPYLA